MSGSRGLFSHSPSTPPSPPAPYCGYSWLTGPRCLTPALLPHPIRNLHCSEFQAAALPLPLPLPLISLLYLKPSTSLLRGYRIAPQRIYQTGKGMTLPALDGMVTSSQLCLTSLWDAKMWTFRDRGYVSTLPLTLGKASPCSKLEPSPSSHYHPLWAPQSSTTGRGKRQKDTSGHQPVPPWPVLSCLGQPSPQSKKDNKAPSPITEAGCESCPVIEMKPATLTASPGSPLYVAMNLMGHLLPENSLPRPLH